MSSNSGSPGANGAGADEKPRLTETEKKQNHIASEQKRREAIRSGFDRLCELIPGLEGQGRSEGLVLKRTVEYIREQLETRRQLVQEREARGEIVDEKLKEPLKILEKLEEADKHKVFQEGDEDEL
ncbi:hypothetical protein JX265_006041 [Neoarthrinium moseri]|uniref:BHLH domain-containing protein n=1 Tax=Neoarthrinium moseri TaxID=1658444 RepID=A0A9Q0AM87_9PEZI|nr:uncharacterized protein JN550_004259 [Neoarthrinium moseri]KAI1855638.1 hypothetical protein JX266_000503 [Neoarthrinium moseri]KAI1871001.1 hypothetical protein JX265_006041 [Neoarthrinium moseri]KAI1872056.1 hypothetical protein JN550_004259 [Neoarthrinium moseri]